MSVATASAAPFATSDVLARLPQMSRSEVDSLGFGVVKVDDSGKIELYNRYEAELAGIEPSQAEGKNFFNQIAPCTNNRIVFGQFKTGVAQGVLDTCVNYTFTYKLRPTPVSIHLLRDSASATNWVLVKKA